MAPLAKRLTSGKIPKTAPKTKATAEASEFLKKISKKRSTDLISFIGPIIALNSLIISFALSGALLANSYPRYIDTARTATEKNIWYLISRINLLRKDESICIMLIAKSIFSKHRHAAGKQPLYFLKAHFFALNINLIGRSRKAKKSERGFNNAIS